MSGKLRAIINGTASDQSDVNQLEALMTGGFVYDAVAGYDAGGGGDVTTQLQAALAATQAGAPFGGTVTLRKDYFNAISDTLVCGPSTTIQGAGWTSTEIWPTITGKKLIDLNGEGSAAIGFGIHSSGSAGYAAIYAANLGHVIERVKITDWGGIGIETHADHIDVRECRVTNNHGDGIVGNPTIGVFFDTLSSDGLGHGFWMTGGNGSIIACSSDTNQGHGFYFTGGFWYLQGYAEANVGDAIRVDGSINLISSMTMTANAAINDDHIFVTGQAKNLPDGTLLRFPDGTVSALRDGMTDWQMNTRVELSIPLATAQTSGTVIPVALEDVNPAGFPTVIIMPGNYDGTMYFNACKYAFVGGAHMPVGGSLTATATAHLIGEPSVMTPKGNARTYGHRGGSYALGAVLGNLDPMPSHGLAHFASPLAEFRIDGSATGYAYDTAALRQFTIPLTAQNQYAASSSGWSTKQLPIGQYIVRVHCKDAATTANNIFVRINPYTGGDEVSQKFTAAVATTFEWFEVEYDHTASRLTNGGQIIVARDTATSRIDVDAIVIVPRFAIVSSTGPVKPGRFTTAGRPSAVTAGAGAMIFDTTLVKPIWSNGTVWKDATGATV